MRLLAATARRLIPVAVGCISGVVAWWFASGPLWQSSAYGCDEIPVFSADGRTLTTVHDQIADADGRLRPRIVRWDARTGRVESVVPLVWQGQPPSPNEILSVVKAGTRLVCGLNRTGTNGYLVYDDAGRKLSEMPPDGRYLYQFSRDGRWLLLATDRPPRADIVATESGATVLSLTPPEGFEYWYAVFSPDGHQIAVLWHSFREPERPRAVYFFDLPSGQATRTVPLPPGRWTGLFDWSTDGRLYVERRVPMPANSDDCFRAIIYRASFDAVEFGPPRDEPLLTSRDGFADGDRYVSQDRDWVVQVDSEPPPTAPWRNHINRAAKFVGLAEPLAARGSFTTRLLDRATGEVRRTLNGVAVFHAVSPDGRLVAATYGSGIAVWEVEAASPVGWSATAGVAAFVAVIAMQRWRRRPATERR